MNKILPAVVAALLFMGTFVAASPAEAALGFVQRGVSSDTPGIISGLWHGMVAPYALLIGIFTNLGIYAYPNQGWVYDAGFLLGVAISLPLGWIIAVISILLLLM